MVDNTDMTILDYLENNARVSYTQLAKKLDVSEAAIRKRIKKLEEQKVILGYKASVNYKKLGFSNKVVIGVDTEAKNYFDVLNSLKTFEEIKNLNTSSGDHMIMFEVWIKDMENLNKVMEKINSIPGVVQSCPSIIHENMK